MKFPNLSPLAVLILVCPQATASQGGDQVPEAASTLIVGNSKVELWTEIQEGQALPHYRVAVNGRKSRIRVTRGDLAMKAGTFDPLIRTPLFPGTLAEHGQLHIVQFKTQPLQAFKDSITAAGGLVLHYLPHQANLVLMDSTTAQTVAKLEYVRWVGPYSAGFRIEPEVLQLIQSEQLPKTGRYHIQVFERGPVQKNLVAAKLRQIGASILKNHPSGFLLGARLTAEQILEVATWNEVLWLDRWLEAGVDMDKVREDSGLNVLVGALGPLGTGVRGEVMDSGIDNLHPDLQDPPLLIHGPFSGIDDHGTSTTGILFGDGSGNVMARGMLPDAQPIFASYIFLTDRYAHTAELLQPPYECVFQSNSWGNGLTTSYTATTMETDDILFLHDIVFLQSQSNQGSQFSRSQAWAKNIVSCGGIQHLDTQILADDAWNMEGSIGPAEDGRIKPDLSYWNDQILTTSAGGYTLFSGTSASTPMIAGTFGAFFELWHKGYFGNTTGNSVFDSRPKATTAKAIMIHSAHSYAFAGATADLTRVHQGWGRPNLLNAIQRVGGARIINETQVLAALQGVAYTIQIRPNTPELRATLVYSDPAGTTSSTQHRINDLSLRVTHPSGFPSYWGNNGLLDGNWSTPGGSSNTIDTVENVFLQNPATGAWTVEVIADQINADGHTESPALDADFALVISGSPTCPVRPNSNGNPTVLIGTPTTATGSNLRLDADGGPVGEFGYFLVGIDLRMVPATIANGFFCLDGLFSRYNIAGTAMNSLGRFNIQNRFENLSGTSSTGFGFDIPTQLPAPISSTISAGQTLHFQLWHRDQPMTSNFSTTLSHTF